MVLKSTFVRSHDGFAFIYLDSSYLNHEHCSSKNMACSVTPKPNAVYIHLLVKVDCFNLTHTFFNVSFCVQHLICRYVAETDEHGKLNK